MVFHCLKSQAVTTELLMAFLFMNVKYIFIQTNTHIKNVIGPQFHHFDLITIYFIPISFEIFSTKKIGHLSKVILYDLAYWS